MADINQILKSTKVQHQQQLKTLKSGYEQRLTRLADTLNNTFSAIQRDSTLDIMKDDPISFQFVKERVSEMLAESVSLDSEQTIQELMEKHSLAVVEKNRIQESLDSAIIRIKRLQSELETQKSIGKNSKTELEESLQEEIERNRVLQNEQARLKAKISELDANMSNCANTRDDLRESAEILADRFSKERNELDQKVKQLTTLLEKSESDRMELRRKYMTLGEQVERLVQQEQLESTHTMESLENRLTRAKSGLIDERKARKKEQSQYIETERELNREIKRLGEEMGALSTSNRTALMRLQQAEQRADSEKNTYEMTCRGLREQISSLQRELDSNAHVFSDAKRKLEIDLQEKEGKLLKERSANELKLRELNSDSEFKLSVAEQKHSTEINRLKMQQTQLYETKLADAQAQFELKLLNASTVNGGSDVKELLMISRAEHATRMEEKCLQLESAFAQEKQQLTASMRKQLELQIEQTKESILADQKLASLSLSQELSSLRDLIASERKSKQIIEKSLQSIREESIVLEQNLAQANSMIEEKSHDIISLKARLSESINQSERLRNRLKDEIEARAMSVKELGETVHRFDEVQRNLAETRQQVIIRQSEIDHLIASLRRLSSAANGTEAGVDSDSVSTTGSGNFSQLLREQIEQCDSLRKKLIQLNADNATLEAKCIQSDRDLESEIDLNRRLEDALKTLETDLENTRNDFSLFQNRVQSELDSARIKQDQLDSERAIVKRLESDIESSKQQLEIRIQEINNLKAKNIDLNSQITCDNELKQQIDNLSSALSSAKEEISVLASRHFASMDTRIGSAIRHNQSVPALISDKIALLHQVHILEDKNRQLMADCQLLNEKTAEKYENDSDNAANLALSKERVTRLEAECEDLRSELSKLRIKYDRALTEKDNRLVEELNIERPIDHYESVPLRVPVFQPYMVPSGAENLDSLNRIGSSINSSVDTIRNRMLGEQEKLSALSIQLQGELSAATESVNAQLEQITSSDATLASLKETIAKMEMEKSALVEAKRKVASSLSKKKEKLSKLESKGDEDVANLRQSIKLGEEELRILELENSAFVEKIKARRMDSKQLAEKTAVLEGQLNEQRDALTALEAEKDDLKMKREAIEQEASKSQFELGQVKSAFLEASSLRNDIENTQNANKKLEACISRVANLRTQSSSPIRKNGSLMEVVESLRQQKLDLANRQIELQTKLTHDSSIVSEELAFQISTIDRQSREMINELESIATTKQDELDSLKKIHNDSLRDLKAHQEDNSTLQNELSGIKQTASSLELSLAKLKKDYENEINLNADLTSKIASIQESLEKVTQNENFLQEQLAYTRNQLQDVVVAQDQTVSTLRTTITSLENECGSLKVTNGNLAGKFESKSSECEANEAILKKLRQEIQKFQDDLSLQISLTDSNQKVYEQNVLELEELLKKSNDRVLVLESRIAEKVEDFEEISKQKKEQVDACNNLRSLLNASNQATANVEEEKKNALEQLENVSKELEATNEKLAEVSRKRSQYSSKSKELQKQLQRSTTTQIAMQSVITKLQNSNDSILASHKDEVEKEKFKFVAFRQKASSLMQMAIASLRTEISNLKSEAKLNSESMQTSIVSTLKNVLSRTQFALVAAQQRFDVAKNKNNEEKEQLIASHKQSVIELKAAHDASIALLDNLISEKNKEMNLAFTKQRNAEERLGEVDRLLSSLQGRLGINFENCESKLKKLNDVILNAISSREDAESSLSKVVEENNSLKRRVDSFRDCLNHTIQTLSSELPLTSQVEHQLLNASSENDFHNGLRLMRSELNKFVSEAKQQRDDLERSLQQELSISQQGYSAAQERIRTLRQELENTKGELDNVSLEKTLNENEIVQLQDQLENFQNESLLIADISGLDAIEPYKKEIEKLRNDLQKIQAEHQSTFQRIDSHHEAQVAEIKKKYAEELVNVRESQKDHAGDTIKASLVHQSLKKSKFRKKSTRILEFNDSSSSS